MAVFENFDIDANTTYILRNKQAAFATSTLRKPDDGQYLAVTWDVKKGEFKPVYFTAFDKKGDAVIPSEHVGERPVGEFQGSDLFIISHPTLGVRPDLRETITAWVEAKHVWDKTTNPDQKRRARSITIGQLVINGVEKHIGKSPITPKPAAPAAEPSQASAAPIATAQQPPREVTRVADAPRNQERDPRSLPPIPAYVSPDEFPETDLPNEQADVTGQVYRGTIKRDFDKGFTFISPDRNIPELDGKDAFLHISVLEPGVELKEGQRVEFELYFNAQRGNYQASAAWPAGMRRQTQATPRDTAPEREFDDEGPQVFERDSQGRAIITHPIRTPFPTKDGNRSVIPGGAWRIKRDPN